ncbi:nucleolar protein 10 isoform X1 [Cricetulus griseus]|uniref:Nucleolar protein 10 n=1 Tax=Cricetulus griseus TaxID=10029 RepID=G3HB02_CRIGR|nr:nucleolar protein 10 isoform X1 [Cricetulus griseus]XP_027280480.1 nucleolar protein 10 isoform X1 [Cricetulus griseus]EGW08479.1 Nucleolar protein 10 [Cricetulus griseus]ERE68280.1 nucleolar protein 10 [Cricetulus griseus]
MQVSSLNEVKIYSLSCGKSLPEWLSDRKKRALQKKDVDVRRRIELIQDFEMPTVCTTIKVSKDGQYILATGTYKPRVRCYDTYQLSLKFERCLDSEVVTFEILSDDYSKIVFLHNDRYIEFHSQSGFYYKTRIPKFGRDFSYHYPSCDLYFVGASSEVYRLNLEQGRYLNPLQTDAAENNVCDINAVHGLFATGTIEGRVECWDPRVRKRVGVLDCALNSVTADSEINSLPTISALKFNGALTMAVGTSTGQVLLYDLRSDKPLLVKDHQYGLPIKSVHFQDSLDLVLSSDSRIVKMWNRNSGKIFTSLEPEHDLNDVCLYPNSGMLLTANEAPKMGIYYIPVLGPAPRWCSFLDNLTEELEENPESTVYDDYKFVTKKDLENLGLTHLIGSPFLRAYMHGFFMDIRLYHKVKLMVNPFAYEEYRKDKIRQKIEETRAQRVQLKKLPKVNKELALKLIEEEEEKQKATLKKKVKSLPNILTDDRFKVMFENPDFQVDEESEEFRLLNPLVSRISEKRKKQLRLLEQQELQAKNEEEEEPEGKPSDAESSESSDDEKAWVEEVRKQRRLLQQEERAQRRREQLEEDQETVLKPQFYEIKAGEEFRSFKESATKQRLMNKTLEDRLKLEAKHGTLNVSDTTVGSKQLTFTLKRSEQQKKQQEAEKLHRQERKKLRRSAGHLRSRPRRGRPFH